jgi:hypothetical protein
VIVGRAGLRVRETLALTEADLEPRRGALLLRRGRGGRRRLARHRLGCAHAVELAGEGVPLIVIERQLGDSNLGTASVSLPALTRPRGELSSRTALVRPSAAVPYGSLAVSMVRSAPAAGV